MKPSDQIDTAKLVRQPPDGVVRHQRLRLAADKLLKRISLYLEDHPLNEDDWEMFICDATELDKQRRVLLKSAILEVKKCLDS